MHDTDQFNKLFHSRTPLADYRQRVWRLVEDQETAATLNVVDNMEEQELLEALLDDVKPPYRAGTENLHYLFKTAFRYPPLQYGSRFGTRLMPSFFYASETRQTALAETAYYRFVFLSHMQEPYRKPIDSQYSMFGTTVHSTRTLDLYSKRYASIADQLAHPGEYSLTQAVGKWATDERQIEIIRFESARNRGSCNAAVADPGAIVSKQPVNLHTWLCRTTQERISFSSRQAKLMVVFGLDQFLHQGRLPSPA